MSLTARRHLPFGNLENLVPSDEWGEWLDGPDFKHFKGVAHRRTTAKLYELFGSLLTAPAAAEALP